MPYFWRDDHSEGIFMVRVGPDDDKRIVTSATSLDQVERLMLRYSGFPDSFDWYIRLEDDQKLNRDPAWRILSVRLRGDVMHVNEKGKHIKMGTARAEVFSRAYLGEFPQSTQAIAQRRPIARYGKILCGLIESLKDGVINADSSV